MPSFKEAEGVHRLPLSIPFPVGPVNVYLLEGDRLGLFDTGLGLDTTWQELVGGLDELGYRPSDIQFVVVSHYHIDHKGLAHRFPQADVYCGRGDLNPVRDVERYHLTHMTVVDRLFSQWGVAGDRRADLLAAADFSSWKGSVPWAEPVDDGDGLSGTGFQVLSTPGHTRGLVSLYRPQDGVLLSSDHLLPRITPSPDLYTEVAPVRSGLPDYITSLRRLLALDVDRVLPGHGRPFPFSRRKIEERLAHHASRLNEVRDAVEDGDTVAGVADRLFGPRDAFNTYLAMREAFAHLEILLASGAVVREAAALEGADLYRRAG